jgi:hypothetical protein
VRREASLFIAMDQESSEIEHNVFPPLKNILSEENSIDATYPLLKKHRRIKKFF